MTNSTINFSSAFSNIAEKLQKPEKVSRVKAEKLVVETKEHKDNGYAFSFAGSYHPQAGASFRNWASVRENVPSSGRDLLEDIGLDSDNFKIHVVPRSMPSVLNPGLFVPTEGHQVVALWKDKQFEMNAEVSANWSDFNWEESLLPPEEMSNALIPWGITAFDNGKRVAMQYLVGDIGNGGVEKGIAYLLTLMGSLDGSLALVGKQTLTRIVCANTFAHVALQKEGTLGRLRRSAGARSKLDLWKSSYAEIVESSTEYQRSIEKMMTRKIQPSEKKDFFLALFGKNPEEVNERQQKMLLGVESNFVNHLAEQPGAEELELNTVWGWVQGLSSWNIRERRTRVIGNIGNFSEDTIKMRSRFDEVLTTDTIAQPAMNYLYQLVA